MNMEDRIENVVNSLAKAACQDFTVRVPIPASIDDAFLQVEMGANILLEDLSLAHRRNVEALAEIEAKNREIAERSAMALRELSNPIIAVWSGILTLPVIGTVDTERSTDMMEALLARVVSDQATHVIIDITGVQVLDTRTADHFIRMAKAVKLLGADCYLTGISPAVAQTMTSLGIDTSGVRTRRRVSDALGEAFSQLGMKVSIDEARAAALGHIDTPAR
ncbi:MAG: STAS domain-containing protein [Archangiaceae bacterium]|nr:STAS domain-containing protein [Archangiaceae bacterium]